MSIERRAEPTCVQPDLEVAQSTLWQKCNYYDFFFVVFFFFLCWRAGRGSKAVFPSQAYKKIHSTTQQFPPELVSAGLSHTDSQHSTQRAIKKS